MTERTKTIKGLISGQVDMGTFGLVELELLAIEKEVEELEDNKDKKYTEDDMIKFAFDTYCYISGIMKVPFNQVSENRTHVEENLKEYIKNK
jgi:hypothetical protein